MGALTSKMGEFTGEAKIKMEKPPWLNSLTCMYPVLNESQIDFLCYVHGSIKSRRRFAAKTSKARVCEINKMADSMKANFELAVKMLQENSSDRQRFQEKYPNWEGSRNLTVSRLRNIADSIDAERQESQSTNIGGTVISMAGGLMCLATGGTVPVVVGSAMMGLGTLTSVGTSIVENLSLQEHIDKVEKIMQQEDQHMKDLFPLIISFNDAKNLQEAINNVKHVNCETDLAPAAEKIHELYNKNLNRRQLGKQIKTILKSISVPEKLREAISDIIGILITIRMLLDCCSPLFKLAAKGYNVIKQLRLSADLFRAAFVGINSAATISNCTKLTSIQKGMIRGGILLDAINIMFLYSQDPNSIEAEEIRKIALQLENEAKQLNSLYQGMIKSP